MHAQPQRTLKRLIKQYGPDLVNDPRRTESLLNDLCGQHRREIFVLVNAQKQRVPAELLAAPTWMPKQATWSRLSRQLQEKLALTEDAADWAVAAWASALDLAPTPAKPGWPWQRQPSPPDASSRGKPKGKKRQTGQVDVQYQTGSARKSKRHAARSARAETTTRPFSLVWPRLGSESVAKLAVWAAMLLVSISLLVVVVSAMTRPNEPDSPADESGLLQETNTAAGVEAAPLDHPGAEARSNSDYLTSLAALPRTAWVTEGPLLIRQGPSTGDAYLATLEAKTGVTVVEFSPDGAWSHIAQPQDGWVSNQFLSFLTDDAAKELVRFQVRRETVSSPLVIYAQPNGDSAQIAQLDPGDALVTVAITLDGAWRQTAAPVTGWVPTQAVAGEP